LDSRLDGVDRIQRERAKQPTERAWGANARARRRRQSFPRVNITIISIRGASARRRVGARAPARASTRILSFEDSLLDALTAIEDAVVVVVMMMMMEPACAARGNPSRRSVLKNVLF